jgi:hypothetical protein
MLVSLREIGMEQPVKEIRRSLLKSFHQLPVGTMSLGGHGHLGWVVM